jgi:large subunit ribosomal protein L17
LGRAPTQKAFQRNSAKFGDRAGGYTRIIRASNRVGDNAKVAILEFVGYQYKEKEKKEKPKKEEATETK